MKLTHIFLISCTILLLLNACSNKNKSSGDVVIASVADSQLLLQDALEEIPEVIFEQDSAGAIQAYAEQWVRKQISIQHAERIGVHQTEKFQEKIDRYYAQALEAQLKEYILEDNQSQIEVTRDEAQNYYQANKDQFILDENYVRFHHLTTRTRTEADNASREIANGTPWEEIVNKYSVDPEVQLRHSSMYLPETVALSDIPALSEYLSIMGITERSPIHFHEGEYHFVQLTDRKSEGENPELEWLIPQIREWLVLEKSRRITNAYIRNLYLQAEANNEIELANVSDINTILYDKFRNQ